ncbi:hypothetical protein NM688_g2135 [Phlebia brevispora]|uniref:Uncharacterized protein n=1 Tax=Phlebia brevispora TaxID=194682 RepID=A0ACC1T956_9APHY|nr:hypothetical protein NM688_g2135 [Phlebia brevispora]
MSREPSDPRASEIEHIVHELKLENSRLREQVADQHKTISTLVDSVVNIDDTLKEMKSLMEKSLERGRFQLVLPPSDEESPAGEHQGDVAKPQYWYKSTWKIELKKLQAANTGKGNVRPSDSVKWDWWKNAYGKLILKDRQASGCEMAHGWILDLMNRMGDALPASWIKKMPLAEKQKWWACIEKMLPELCYCDGHWKANELMRLIYSLFMFKLKESKAKGIKMEQTSVDALLAVNHLDEDDDEVSILAAASSSTQTSTGTLSMVESSSVTASSSVAAGKRRELPEHEDQLPRKKQAGIVVSMTPKRMGPSIFEVLTPLPPRPRASGLTPMVTAESFGEESPGSFRVPVISSSTLVSSSPTSATPDPSGPSNTGDLTAVPSTNPQDLGSLEFSFSESTIGASGSGDNLGDPGSSSGDSVVPQEANLNGLGDTPSQEKDVLTSSPAKKGRNSKKSPRIFEPKCGDTPIACAGRGWKKENPQGTIEDWNKYWKNIPAEDKVRYTTKAKVLKLQHK